MPPEAELQRIHDGDRETQQQLEWDRLQREALAAQRDRLEQEIQQARKLGLLSTEVTEPEPFMGIHWNYRWLLAGIVLLMVGGVGYEFLFFD